jgi:hypothetical protein
MLLIFIMHQYFGSLTALHQRVGAENVMVQLTKFHQYTHLVIFRVFVQHMVKNGNSLVF